MRRIERFLLRPVQNVLLRTGSAFLVLALAGCVQPGADLRHALFESRARPWGNSETPSETTVAWKQNAIPRLIGDHRDLGDLLHRCQSVLTGRRRGCRSAAPARTDVIRAHYLAAQDDGETSAFVLQSTDFIEGKDELTPAGCDKLLEIACQMRCLPLPIVIEHSPSDQDRTLDAQRRDLVTQLLTDLGNFDACDRTQLEVDPQDATGGEMNMAARFPSGSASTF